MNYPILKSTLKIKRKHKPNKSSKNEEKKNYIIY